MGNDELSILLLLILVFMAFHLLSKLYSIERKLDRLLSSSPTEDQALAIDDEVRALISAGKVNKAIALYAKRYNLSLIDAERTIKKITGP
jgi:hypothetical protein